MDLDEEILARVRAAKALDKEAKLSDFQLDIVEGGAALIHLKTRRVQRIDDDESELSELTWLIDAKAPENQGGRRRLKSAPG